MTIGRTDTGTTRTQRGLCLEHGKLNGTLSRIPSGPAATVQAASKAGHMPAPDQTVINQKATCQREAVHTCPLRLFRGRLLHRQGELDLPGLLELERQRHGRASLERLLN